MRATARFVWHYLEMVIAMFAGMFALGALWDLVLPELTRFDVRTLIMAADMTVGMAAWMKVRRHGWAPIGEMSLAMMLPFVILLVPYWFGVLSPMVVMSAGHAGMFVLMLAAMLIRRQEYTRHQPRWVKPAGFALAVLLLPGAVSAVSTVGKFKAQYAARADTVTASPVRRAHDPAKPTVALVTSGNGTNVTDLLGPYEVLASTGKINAYVVSPGSRVIPLTGGLDLVPDYTFAEFDSLMAAQHDRAEAVVVPALNKPEPAELGAITSWIRRQHAAGAIAMSVCNGARTLAATGLLDGRPATSHWYRLPGLRSDFTAVKWTDGVRYVDDGDVITAAGVLSGVDGALRLVERFFDTETARTAAGAVQWRHYSPGAAAAIPVYSWELPDIAMILNASWQPGPTTIGVQLTAGVGELELAAPFTSYTEQTVIGRTVSIGSGPILSAHGLTFVPRAANADGVDRLVVPGAAAARAHAVPGGVYLHTAPGFAFDPVISDITRTYDVRTATEAIKTLQYPEGDVRLAGSAWPWGATLVPLGLALLGLGVTVAGVKLVRRRKGSAPAREPVSV
ncbi:MAG: AraC family transcriptional regulator [Nonomuraea sp.]|nr:AraC family transcriptional regulator [Nonomuraea sp.]